MYVYIVHTNFKLTLLCSTVFCIFIKLNTQECYENFDQEFAVAFKQFLNEGTNFEFNLADKENKLPSLDYYYYVEDHLSNKEITCVPFCSQLWYVYVCMRVYMCACVRACMRVYVCAMWMLLASKYYILFVCINMNIV